MSDETLLSLQIVASTNGDVAEALNELATLTAEVARLKGVIQNVSAVFQDREDSYMYCIWCGESTYPKHECELTEIRDELAAALADTELEEREDANDTN